MTSFDGILNNYPVMSILKIISLAFLSCVSSNEYLRLCYYTNWSRNRTNFTFFPENIDTRLCSHIIMAFARLESKGNITNTGPIDLAEGPHPGLYERLTILKKCKKKLIILLAVESWPNSTKELVDMLETKDNRNAFIHNSIKYLRKWNFDGLDLWFKYNKEHSFQSSDKERYTLLLEEFRKAIDEENAPNSPKLLLTAAVSGNKTYIDNAYEIKEIEKYLDFVNLNSYDFHGPWESSAKHSSPLYSESDSESLDGAVKYWLNKGLPATKLVIGMALYGRCFNLAKSNVNELNSATTGACPGGQYTNESSLRSYYEICGIVANSVSKNRWIKEQAVPYVVSNEYWIAYENKKSLRAKVDYLKKNKLRGWFVWDLSMDDFTGAECESGKYPLLKELNSALKRPVEMDCEVKVRGIYEHPTNCKMYFTCNEGISSISHCPQDLYFNVEQKSCTDVKHLSSERTKYCLTSKAEKFIWSWMVLFLVLWWDYISKKST